MYYAYLYSKKSVFHLGLTHILFPLALGLVASSVFRFFLPKPLTRIFHELLSPDHAGGRAIEQPQGVDPEAYLHGTSRGELVLSLSKEPPRTHGRTAISAVAAGDS